MFKFGLGIKVKDLLTGFSGVTIARSDYYGSDTHNYLVQSHATDPGKFPASKWLDESRLAAVEDEKVAQ